MISDEDRGWLNGYRQALEDMSRNHNEHIDRFNAHVKEVNRKEEEQELHKILFREFKLEDL